MPADDKIMQFVFTLDTDVLIHERSVYNILDLIGDVGGLIEGIGYITGAFLFVINLFIQNPMTQYLVSAIFTLPDLD